MINIKDFTKQEIEANLKEWSFPQYYAQDIFRWIYQKNITDFSLMTSLPLGLRNRLKESFLISSLNLIKALKSFDGTEKFLFSLEDKNVVESVIIPSEDRFTACISSQVGCKYACSFCASGLSGFKRNLSSGEILDQLFLARLNSEAKRITHVVFMGTGEPFDNYDAVIKAIRIINEPYAFHIGARRITISSCGVIPGLDRLALEKMQIELSISLHAADQATRNMLMPVNKKYPLNDLIDACKKYIQKTNRQITFEYILIKGINSDLPSAQKLGKLLTGMNCKVNLIPANVIAELDISPPGKLDILYFKNMLIKSGLHVTLRKSRGLDIDAACGQLRLSHEKNKN